MTNSSLEQKLHKYEAIRKLHDVIGTTEEEFEKAFAALTDEELYNIASYYISPMNALRELWKRYKNKKKECETLYKERPLPGPCGERCRLVTRSDQYCGCTGETS